VLGQWRWAAAVALAGLGLSACGATKTVTVGASATAANQSSTTTSSAASSASSTATAGTTSNAVLGQAQSSAGLTIQVNALKRTSSDIVELDFTVINNTSNSPDVSELFGGLAGRDVSAVTLVDEPNQKEYLTVQDSSGNCQCSGNLFDDTPGFGPHTHGSFYAEFPAPPATVTSVDVDFPTAPPIHNVPISG
jgi:hypothetical protein